MLGDKRTIIKSNACAKCALLLMPINSVETAKGKRNLLRANAEHVFLDINSINILFLWVFESQAKVTAWE